MPIKQHPTICYPFEHMIPGDSFFVPVYDLDIVIKEVTALAEALSVRIKIKAGIEHGFYGIRVWRVK